MECCLWLTSSWLIFIVAAILGVVLCPIIIPESWPLRYHAMHASYLVGAFCVATFSLITFNIISSDRCVRLSRSLCLIWVRLMGWDVHTWRHLEVLIQSKNAVVVVNHQSSFDVFPFISVWNQLSSQMMAFVGSELKHYVVLGRGIQQVSAIHFLNRKKPHEAMATLISDTRDHFKQNENNKIIIFPEGTRNLKIREREWKFGEFKLGPFRVAKELDVPVIPVVISPYYFLDQDRRLFARGKTIVSVMGPIQPGDESAAEFKEKIKQLMQNEFFRLQNELLDERERRMSETNPKNL